MGAQRTILVVDDSKTARLMTCAILLQVRPDWVIVDACNGEDALAKLESMEIEAALLDLNMPGIDGIELGSQLRDRFPNAHIGILTANIQKKVEERAASLGFQFLGKPVTKEVIKSFAAEADKHE